MVHPRRARSDQDESIVLANITLSNIALSVTMSSLNVMLGDKDTANFQKSSDGEKKKAATGAAFWELSRHLRCRKKTI